jgi:hypothetical protein
LSWGFGVTLLFGVALVGRRVAFGVTLQLALAFRLVAAEPALGGERGWLPRTLSIW